MELFAVSSGLTGLLTDAREFLAAVRLARPDALWLLLLLPVLGLLNRWAARRRKRAVMAIGRPAAVAGQLTHPHAPRGLRRWLGLAYPLAWLLLILGVAGPRWGKSEEAGVAVGRDLVIVIDLSRSMLADDMSDPKAKTRWEAARAGALDLMQAVARRGGHRVAVVVFAAKAKVLCPLTTDYEHVKAILEDIDGKYPPPEIRPGNDPNAVSGTRIGAGLIAAVQAHDEQFTGSQDIILISDGDDPVPDKEWLRGSSVAAAAHIPVHTVGVGGVTTPAVLELGTDVQDFVGTVLHEEPLKQIAEDTRGVYLAARRDTPNLGEFFRTRIEPNPSREYTGDQIPQPKERYPWFLAPALLLFLVGWLRGR
jgi:Ca-activated chloride channel family protein